MFSHGGEENQLYVWHSLVSRAGHLTSFTNTQWLSLEARFVSTACRHTGRETERDRVKNNDCSEFNHTLNCRTRCIMSLCSSAVRSSCVASITEEQLLRQSTAASFTFVLIYVFFVWSWCVGLKSSPPQKQLSCCFRDGLSCQNVKQQKLFRESRASGLHLSKRPELAWSSATVW